MLNHRKLGVEVSTREIFFIGNDKRASGKRLRPEARRTLSFNRHRLSVTWEHMLWEIDEAESSTIRRKGSAFAVSRTNLGKRSSVVPWIWDL
jgi:hypothetical protein